MPFHSMITIPKASYNKRGKCNRIKLRQDNKKHTVNDTTTLFSKGIQREPAKYLNRLFTLTITFNSSLHTLIVIPF